MDNEDDNKITPENDTDGCFADSRNDDSATAENTNPETATYSSRPEHFNDTPVIPPSTIPMEKVTIKEIFDEIMDCTIVSNATICNNKNNTKNLENKKLSVLFPTSQSKASVCTIKDIVNRILDYTVCPSTRHSNETEMSPEENLQQYREVAGSSRNLESGREIQFEINEVGKDFQIYRSHNSHRTKSESAIFEVKNQQDTSASLKSMGHLLPSYSTVMKLPIALPPKFIKPIASSISFIPKQPPPSYAEVEGIWEDLQSIISSESVIFGPDPIYIICPRCRRVVVTHIEHQRSNFSHLAALLLSVCFCWPCCLLPYCFTTCSYTHHSCPHCNHYFGMHRPF